MAARQFVLQTPIALYLSELLYSSRQHLGFLAALFGKKQKIPIQQADIVTENHPLSGVCITHILSRKWSLRLDSSDRENERGRVLSSEAQTRSSLTTF